MLLPFEKRFINPTEAIVAGGGAGAVIGNNTVADAPDNHKIHISCFARYEQDTYVWQLMRANNFTNQEIDNFINHVNIENSTGALTNGNNRIYTVTIIPLYRENRGRAVHQWLEKVMADIKQAQEQYFRCPHMHLVLDQLGFQDTDLFRSRWEEMVLSVIPPVNFASYEFEMN